MSSYLKLGTAFALSLSLVVAAGCKSEHDNRSAMMTQSIDGMQTVRSGLADGIKQVDDTLASMNALSTATDLNAAMTDFNAKVAAIQAADVKAKAQAADMRARGREYVDQWEEEMGKVTDPSMRSAMEARQEAVRSKFAGIRDSLRSAGDAYTPFNANLKDVQTALSLDMTPAGVKVAAPTISKANAEGATLKQDLNAAIAQLDQVMGTMGAAPPAK